jgi:hypothetical protein
LHLHSSMGPTIIVIFSSSVLTARTGPPCTTIVNLIEAGKSD